MTQEYFIITKIKMLMEQADANTIMKLIAHNHMAQARQTLFIPGQKCS
jgi:hypothetical protein